MDMIGKTRNVRSNIWKLYAARALSGCLFGIPVIVLLFQRSGLTLREVFLVQSAFALTIVALEIPSGYLSDRWGRRPTLACGFAVCALGYVLYANAFDFWTFVIAEICIGIGASFFSGTYEAMTYDTLLELGEEKDNRRVAGNQLSLDLATESVATIASGIIALWSIQATMWMSAVAFVMAAIVAFSLVEPSRHKRQENRHWRELWDVTTHTLVRHRGLRSITLIASIINAITLMLFWFTQPYQTVVELPLFLWGAAHAAVTLAGAAAARYAGWLEARYDDRKILIGVTVTVVSVCLGLGLLPAHWAFLSLFLISRMAWCIVGPLTTDIVNRMATSDIRATVLSASSFGTRLLFIAASPLVAGLADDRGLPLAFSVMGILGGGLLAIVFFRLRTVWAEIPR